MTPYEWIPAPKDMSLEVLSERPPSTTINISFFSGIKEILAQDGKHYYFCPKCKGWIEGHPNEDQESTLGPLCGRQGTAYYCRRCGNEIGFFGMVS